MGDPKGTCRLKALKPGQVSFEHKAGCSQQGMQALELHGPGQRPVHHQQPYRKSGYRVVIGECLPRSAEPPRGQGALLECVLYAYGHPQALGLQVCPGASSKPRCPLRTFSHRAAQEAHGPTRPGLDRGLSFTCFSRELWGCRWSPLSSSHRPCCCLDRMAGAPVMPASEGRNYPGLKPLCIGPQHLLLGLVKGALCEYVRP